MVEDHFNKSTKNTIQGLIIPSDGRKSLQIVEDPLEIAEESLLKAEKSLKNAMHISYRV